LNEPELLLQEYIHPLKLLLLLSLGLVGLRVMKIILTIFISHKRSDVGPHRWIACLECGLHPRLKGLEVLKCNAHH